jgi:hypothetical protein
VKLETWKTKQELTPLSQYGLLGMTENEYDLVPDYNLSKKVLYTHVMRHLLQHFLFPLLWIESPDREISCHELPSWVVDHSTRQSRACRAMNALWSYFCANEDFPTAEPKVYTRFENGHGNDSGVFELKGIYVGRVTEIRDCEIMSGSESGNDNSLRLFGYQTPSETHSIDKTDGEDGNIRNTSWGPCKTEPGDMIIVVEESTVPLVLRESAGDFLFVGGCWLIDAEFQDFAKLRHNQGIKDPGFSKVMFGGACTGIGVNGTRTFRVI